MEWPIGLKNAVKKAGSLVSIEVLPDAPTIPWPDCVVRAVRLLGCEAVNVATASCGRLVCGLDAAVTFSVP